MSTKANCIRAINETKSAITDINAAYVARTRLRRLILNCGRMIARENHLVEPILPDRLEVPANASDHVRMVALCCNRLLEQANILCQPSEPLDDRWKANWKSVLSGLEQLRELISEVLPAGV